MNRYFLAMWITQHAKGWNCANRVVEIAGQMTEEEIRKQESIVEDSFNAQGVQAVITNFIKMEQ